MYMSGIVGYRGYTLLSRCNTTVLGKRNYEKKDHEAASKKLAPIEIIPNDHGVFEP